MGEADGSCRTSGWGSVGQRVVDFVFALAAIVLLWVLLLIALTVFVSIVAPGSGTDPFASAWYALLMAVVFWVAAIRALRWARDIPDERVTVAGTHAADRLSPVIRDFRVRSRAYLIAAAGLFLLLAFVTVTGFFVVSTPARLRSEYHEALPGQLGAIVSPFIDTNADRQTLRDPDLVRLLSAILEHGSYPAWSDVIGSLVLLVFLVQVIAFMFHYMIRLASFYDSRADYLQISGKVDGLAPADLLAVVDASLVSNYGRMGDALRSFRRMWAAGRSDGV